MTRPASPLRSPLAAAALVATAALASLTPQRAAAESYDVDCKLILCLPAGFPSGCSDALHRMVDRLRHGKSPIGFCALSDGTEYDAFDVDYARIPAQSPQGWKCPPGKSLYHRVGYDDEQPHYRINTFCYDAAYGAGQQGYQRFTGKTRPERMDFRSKLTIEPGTPNEFTQGWQTFNTGMARDSAQVSFSE